MSNAANPSAWQRLLTKGGAARWSLVVLATVLLAAVFGPMLLPDSARELSANQFAAPSWVHPFGTDLHGQDMLYRVLSGARVSLAVGVAGALIAFFIGTAYGLVAGYAGGKTDGAMMRFVEILYAVPRLIILLIAINAFDSPMRSIRLCIV